MGTLVGALIIAVLNGLILVGVSDIWRSTSSGPGDHWRRRLDRYLPVRRAHLSPDAPLPRT